MTAEEKYESFIKMIDTIAEMFGYKCKFNSTFIFDSGFDVTINVDDTTFEF